MKKGIYTLLITFTVVTLTGYLGIGCSEDIAGTGTGSGVLREGLWVATGLEGTILTSISGIDWTPQTSGIDVSL